MRKQGNQASLKIKITHSSHKKKKTLNGHIVSVTYLGVATTTGPNMNDYKHTIMNNACLYESHTEGAMDPHEPCHRKSDILRSVSHYTAALKHSALSFVMCYVVK